MPAPIPERTGFLLLAVICAALSACGSLTREHMSGDHGSLAPIVDFEDVRAVNGYASGAMQRSFSEAMDRRSERWQTEPGAPSHYEILVLGSGGPNGAFGAGLLKGWTASGERPVFDVVTGVSVGALMAPFAFVGSEMDGQLERIFRMVNPEDIYSRRAILMALLDESLADATPIRKLITNYCDEELLEAVALAHEDGRRLYVGTTNFDIGQLVVWDMGAIATRRTEQAAQLFRNVLLASASIPVFYPPVLFDVQDQAGAPCQEMHVDGSITSPMFLPHETLRCPNHSSVDASAIGGPIAPARPRSVITVIHNGSLNPVVAEVPRDTVEIAIRTFLISASSMVKEALLEVYLQARCANSDFRLAYMPAVEELRVNGFTAKQTNRLFELGEERGRACAFDREPPEFLVGPEVRSIQPVGN